ncbi:ABC transporter permease subunit [Ruthenibacterium lactatiformans]|uniref:ABC transporter permease subunit n=1 Tax=Ruthenibacterium lactatiformans TaxID=1550024 RepID=UPI0030B92468
MYIAALAGVDPTLHEAAKIDGASRWQRVLHIDLPTLMPTISIMFIMACGSIMNVGFEKAYLLQNKLNLNVAEVLQTYVYKVGLINAQYSFSAAINLFSTVINIILLLVMNQIVKKLSDTSLL